MKSYAHCSTSTTPSVGSGHDLQLISRVPPCSLKHIDTSCSLQQIQSTCQIPSELFRERNPAQSAGNTAAPPPAKELEKMLTLHQGVLVFISFTHLEQRGVKEAREHMFPLLFIQKKKPNLWVPGSSFQVPDPRFRTFGCSVVRNWSVVIDKICVVT
ncbi:hypothetical protein DY000_02039447 [Brassica cretica]|uniref:Uncharacterized protein n=1 Tax=Brassica cretica TaxID=69181 RepID=A0ABQ7BEM8_BRACR|nr:hypothetical protein DY000_02039447 [Brassica cretica]